MAWAKQNGGGAILLAWTMAGNCDRAFMKNLCKVQKGNVWVEVQELQLKILGCG
jgi:hypothetical protein